MPCSSEATPRRGIARLKPPAVELTAVARYMGIGGEVEPGSDIDKAIRGGIALAEPAIHPTALWGYTDILEIGRDSITVALPGAEPVVVPAKGRLFQGAAGVLFTLLTLGPDIDRLLGEIYAGDDFLLGMAVNATASAAMSAVGNHFRASRRAALANEGLQTGSYYCPGCQALPLESQKAIFAILRPEQIGVQLSEACLMSPAKSVTNAAPVGAVLPEWMPRVDPCTLCNLRATCAFKSVRG